MATAVTLDPLVKYNEQGVRCNRKYWSARKYLPRLGLRSLQAADRHGRLEASNRDMCSTRFTGDRCVICPGARSYTSVDNTPLGRA